VSIAFRLPPAVGPALLLRTQAMNGRSGCGY
jgi:hypothetical protein